MEMMDKNNNVEQKPITEHFDTVVIGGGQAGLAIGYYLAQQSRNFVILEANDRIGASWRKRWDSLRLFTPAEYDSLPGLPFPAPPDHLPNKDEMANYLEAYATRFQLPVRLGTKVDALTREDDCYILTAGDRRFEADRVVVATGPFQKPRVPAFVSKLDPAIMQLHSSEYRNPTQLQTGDPLVVGVGNSGAEIALELAKTRRIWLSGRETGHIPQIRNRILSRPYWWFIHKFLNIDRWVGRRFKAAAGKKGAPLVGISNKDFERAGVERIPRAVGVQDGQPLLEDGRVLDVTNVVWATGFILDFSWIKLPVFGADDYPVHYRGVVESEPGLYFIGLPFLYTLTSALIGGARRDAEYIAKHIATQSKLPDSMAPTREEQAHETVTA